jgi:hypothetical protein
VARANRRIVELSRNAEMSGHSPSTRYWSGMIAASGMKRRASQKVDLMENK